MSVGCSSSEDGTTLVYDAVYDHQSVADAAPHGDSPGDQQLISGRLLNADGAAGGTFAVVCTWVDVGVNGILELCDSWLRTSAADVITSTGPSSDVASDLTWAVTGGSGRFSGARGEVHIHGENDRLEVTVELSGSS